MLAPTRDLVSHTAQAAVLPMPWPYSPEAEDEVTIRVLLVDDQAVVREGLRMLVEREPDMKVVGEAGQGDEALQLAEHKHPDVVVMDLTLQAENDGALYTRRMLNEHQGLKVIVLSNHSERRFVDEAFHAGASGYLSKDACFDEVAAAVRAVTAGGTFVSSHVAQVLDGMPAAGRSTRPSPLSCLTEREREVLTLIAAGKNAKQVAYELSISAKTVDTHRRNLMEKLRVDNVADLTRLAIREGLAPL